MNYSIYEELVELECFEGTERGLRNAMLISLSFVIHWTHTGGKPTAKLGLTQMDRVWGVGKPSFRKALKILEDCGLIRCVKPWQRSSESKGEYVYTGPSSVVTQVLPLYNSGSRDMSLSNRVNNYNNNYNKKNNSFIKNNSSSKVIKERDKKLTLDEVIKKHQEIQRNNLNKGNINKK